MFGLSILLLRSERFVGVNRDKVATFEYTLVACTFWSTVTYVLLVGSDLIVIQQCIYRYPVELLADLIVYKLAAIL